MLCKLEFAAASNGPALRRRRAGHGPEAVVGSPIYTARGIRRADDGPRAPVPVLDQGAVGAAEVPADGPAVGRRCARDAVHGVVVSAGSTRRADDGPRP